MYPKSWVILVIGGVVPGEEWDCVVGAELVEAGVGDVEVVVVVVVVVEVDMEAGVAARSKSHGGSALGVVLSCFTGWQV